MAKTLSDPPVPADWARHTPTSDPGGSAALLEAVAPTAEAITPVIRNLTAHYRAEAEHLPAATAQDVDLRWVDAMLAVDQDRHPGLPLDAPREIGARLQGCCRDRALLAVAVLRQHGVPARSRVGFADYFEPGWHHDHVVAEMHDGRRWRRFDPALGPGYEHLPDPTDLAVGRGTGFTTAAEAYRALRAGALDAATFGVAPGHPLSGERFVHAELFWELAHRYGDELLLWDGWGAIPPPGERADAELLALLDEVAAQLVAADAGDLRAERALYERYVRDDRLHPGPVVMRFSPVGEGPVPVALREHRRGAADDGAASSSDSRAG